MTLKTEWKSHISACQNSINEIRSSHDGNKAHNTDTSHHTPYHIPKLERREAAQKWISLYSIQPVIFQLNSSQAFLARLTCLVIMSSQANPFPMSCALLSSSSWTSFLFFYECIHFFLFVVPFYFSWSLSSSSVLYTSFLGETQKKRTDETTWMEWN